MNESVTDDLKKLTRLARVYRWEVQLKGDDSVVVTFTRRRGQDIPHIAALLTVDSAYPIQPTSVQFLDPDSSEPNGTRGWPNDQNSMFKTAPTWQPGPFVCTPGVQEYHLYPGHNSEPVDPTKTRLPSICSRIQQGIDGETFAGRVE